MKRARFLMAVMTVALVGAVALQAAPVLAAKGGVPDEVAALRAQVAALQGKVDSLTGQVATLQGQNTGQQAAINSLTSQVTQLNNSPAQALAPYVSVDPNPINGLAGPHVIFTGANVHVRSGSGVTDDFGQLRGLGNLLVGYNDYNPNIPISRTGSHNVIIGTHHNYTNHSGLVAGSMNTISGVAATVTGGWANIASNDYASVSGGCDNKATGKSATVSGGLGNIASGDGAHLP